ncbi:MAG: 7,8-didemethyl-8-hydroxy-5-deazariboflavin synthase subunit CofG [Methanosphaera sp. rholeuAM270]|nr:MAG: 7,8-didemethyl-8-hydroxy-5-deazariboflavin synthase subunit CofG [Methanosphaera sp. rholeuAM270]
MSEKISKQEARELLSSDFKTYLNLLQNIAENNTNKQITFSKNIFLPLTHICQNSCGYCTFKQEADESRFLLLSQKEVFHTVKDAKNWGCTEALFAFGESADKNEHVMNKLNDYGFESMVDYVHHLSEEILNSHGLLPHTNMGILSRKELNHLSQVNASMGLMLETTNRKLMKTVVHKDSPGKHPRKRLKFIRNAGKEKIPFTTGLLIGIGETTEDHINSLFEIRRLHDKYGHIQEIILQNFKPKKDIPMADYPEPPVIQLLKLTVLASIMFPDISIQIPPNLNSNLLPFFVLCGADDFGGISPLTKDYINPENEWPSIENLKSNLNEINYTVKERLAVYDKFISREFLNENVYEKALKLKGKIS